MAREVRGSIDPLLRDGKAAAVQHLERCDASRDSRKGHGHDVGRWRWRRANGPSHCASQGNTIFWKRIAGSGTLLTYGLGRWIEAALKICKRLPACHGRAHASQVEARCMRRLECGFDTRLLAAGALDVGALRRLTRRPHRGRVGPGVQG